VDGNTVSGNRGQKTPARVTHFHQRLNIRSVKGSLHRNFVGRMGFKKRIERIMKKQQPLLERFVHRCMQTVSMNQAHPLSITADQTDACYHTARVNP
jgi:hypothetical protein